MSAGDQNENDHVSLALNTPNSQHVASVGPRPSRESATQKPGVRPRDFEPPRGRFLLFLLFFPFFPFCFVTRNLKNLVTSLIWSTLKIFNIISLPNLWVDARCKNQVSVGLLRSLLLFYTPPVELIPESWKCKFHTNFGPKISPNDSQNNKSEHKTRLNPPPISNWAQLKLASLARASLLNAANRPILVLRVFFAFETPKGAY